MGKKKRTFSKEEKLEILKEASEGKVKEIDRNVSYATYTVICAEVVDAVCFTTN